LPGRQWHRTTKNVSRKQIPKKWRQRESARAKPADDEDATGKTPGDRSPVGKTCPAADPCAE
jgi:hypothetical protein